MKLYFCTLRHNGSTTWGCHLLASDEANAETVARQLIQKDIQTAQAHGLPPIDGNGELNVMRSKASSANAVNSHEVRA